LIEEFLVQSEKNRAGKRMFSTIKIIYKDIKFCAMRGENYISRFAPEIREVKQGFGFSPDLYILS
jgi:hypothetical protein